MAENYILNIQNKLTDNTLHTQIINDNMQTIQIVGYFINNSGKYPFLEFMLINDVDSNQDDMLVFPTLLFEPYANDINQVLCDQIISYLGKLSKANIVFNADDKIIPQGFIDYETTRYFIVNINISKIDSSYFTKNSTVWFGLLSEILNNKNICDIPIDKCTCNFIMDQYHLFILNDPTTLNSYPIPDVVYYGSHLKMTKLQNWFGIEKEKRTLGEYFYYTYSLQDAIRDGGWIPNFLPENKYNDFITDNEYGRYTSGGVNRIALLIDKMLYINDNDLNNNQDILSFIETNMALYDSIFVYSTKKSFIITNDFKRQINLSYHQIDKNTLGESWTEAAFYSIE